MILAACGGRGNGEKGAEGLARTGSVEGSGKGEAGRVDRKEVGTEGETASNMLPTRKSTAIKNLNSNISPKNNFNNKHNSSSSNLSSYSSNYQCRFCNRNKP